MTKRRPLRSTDQGPRLAAVEHEVRKHRARSIGAAPDRRRRPERRAEIAVADAGPDLDRPVLRITLRARRNRRPCSVSSQRGATARGVTVKSATRENQSASDADLARDAVRLQNGADSRRRRHSGQSSPATRRSGYRHRAAAANKAAGRPARCPSPAGSPARWPNRSRAWRASSLVECSNDPSIVVDDRR